MKILKHYPLKILLIIIFVFSISCKKKDTAYDTANRKPNIIIILTDDMGYGDMSCQGHPLIRTPNMDQMAAEGQRWTSFYASSCVCNPSRAALLTGRLPYRIHNKRTTWALVPSHEFTIAEMLSQQGYKTACIGKWHLGMEKGSHPMDQGFDFFYGMAGSNDAPIRDGSGFVRTLENVRNASFSDFNIKLYRQYDIIEDTVQQDLLTQRYTEESLSWIKENSEGPFFLYLAHNMPHVPIYASEKFKGKSKAGLYGDVIEEIDWSVGEIIHLLEKINVDKNTLVVFSSDNGPWLTYYDLGGSPGHLRDGKFTAWEGGFRVPGLFWWPGTIKPGVIDDIGANVDLMATVASLAGASLPNDRFYDSYDLSPTLLNKERNIRKDWIYYGKNPDRIWAVRSGNYKMHLLSKESIGTEKVGWRGYSCINEYNTPVLIELNTDLKEQFDISERHPEIIEKMETIIKNHKAGFNNLKSSAK